MQIAAGSMIGGKYRIELLQKRADGAESMRTQCKTCRAAW